MIGQRVELCKLSDGKVSVRLDSAEVAILPRRAQCELDDLTRAIEAVLANAEGGEW